MSGISPTSSLPNGGLSSVGAALESSGGAPVAASSAAKKQSPYQTELQTLNQQDTAELLYASFLSPADGLANADSVLQQAATLLGTPGHPGSSISYAPASASTTASNVPSVSSIIAASDDEANKTLANFANAPAGSSILDVQA